MLKKIIFYMLSVSLVFTMFCKCVFATGEGFIPDDTAGKYTWIWLLISLSTLAIIFIYYVKTGRLKKP